MSRHLYAPPSLHDLSIGTDEKGRALNAHIGFPVHLLLGPNAVSLDRGLLFVSEKGHRKTIFVTEFRVRFDAIRGDAENPGLELVEFRLEPAEINRFLRATRRVVLGIEIDDGIVAFQIAERDGIAFRVLQAEIRSCFTICNHSLSLP